MTISLKKYWTHKKGIGPGPVGIHGALKDLRYMNFNKEGLSELLADLKTLTPEEVRSSEYLIANIWCIPKTMWQWMPHFAPPHPDANDYSEITYRIQGEVYRLLGIPDFDSEEQETKHAQ